MNSISSDVLGMIFAHLDLKSMAALALTCRRYLRLFAGYPSAIIFKSPWSYRYEDMVVNPLTYRHKNTTLVYTGPPPIWLCQDFNETRWTSDYNVDRFCQRLSYLRMISKEIEHFPLETVSGKLDYYVDAVHIFTLIFNDDKRSYIQYHRNHQAMIWSTFDKRVMTSCHIFDRSGTPKITVTYGPVSCRYSIIDSVSRSLLHDLTFPVLRTTSLSLPKEFHFVLRPDDIVGILLCVAPKKVFQMLWCSGGDVIANNIVKQCG